MLDKTRSHRVTPLAIGAAVLVAVALAAAGLGLSVGTAGAATVQSVAPATPVESAIAVGVQVDVNRERALRGASQLVDNSYLDTMAQGWVDSPTGASGYDPTDLWMISWETSHPCTVAVYGSCPTPFPQGAVPSATTLFPTSSVSGAFSASVAVDAWMQSPPHRSLQMFSGDVIIGAGVDCATGVMVDIFAITPHDLRGPAPQTPWVQIPPATGPSCSSQTPHPTTGYRMVAGDGGVFDFGTAQFYGSMGGKALNQPVVASASTPTGSGYWEVASDGGIFSFGNAQFYGSMGGHPLNQPIVGMAVDPATGGYWEVARDGGIFSFGAPFYGSMGGHPLNQPIVGMAATPTGGGYWEVASDGGIFSFGNAQFHGSMGGHPLNQPIVGMAATPTGGGYWEVSTTGGIFSFHAPYYGSALGMFGGYEPGVPGTVVGMAVTPTGGGYWIANSLGQVVDLGQAPNLGDITPFKLHLNQPMVGFAVS